MTTTSDGGPGSLRAAFTTANENGTPDAILLEEGQTYVLTICGGPGEGDTNAHGDLDHSAPDALSIIGRATIRNSCPAERLIEALPGSGPLHLRSQTLTGGASNGSGGAIETVDTPVTIVGGVIAGNRAAEAGGGLSTTSGDVEMVDSTFSGNEAGANGGAVHTLTHANLWITRSSFSRNHAAGEGGAIASEGGVSILNGTFSRNTAGTSGGMIVAEGGTTLNNATAVGNSAPAGTGGGIRLLPSARVEISNSLLDGNGAENCDESGGTIISLGHNISSDASCNLSRPSDQPSTDPMVRPLADNGGGTDTHALMPASPAIGKGRATAAREGGPACEPVDQRGAPRRKCDIGAYEFLLCGGSVVNVIGSAAADVLRGTAAADGILGRGSRDTLWGRGGRDGLCGGADPDRLRGGAGADFLQGGPGPRDRCRGQGGSDETRGCESRRRPGR